MHNSISVGLVLLMLSGCTVIGPDYFRPQVAVPANWSISYEAAADAIDSAWWQQFDDPVIDELISTALTNNLDLKAAVARVDRYLGQLRTTRSEYFPQIGVSVSGFRQDDSDTATAAANGPYSYYQGAFNASWELDLWGRVRRLNESAQAELLASEAGRRSVLLSLVSSVARNYLVLRGLDRQLEIARETAKAYNESLRIFQLRHKYGTVSALEVSQIESEYENAVQAIPRLESQVAQQEHLLSLLLGQNPGRIPRGKVIDDLVVPGIPAGLPAELLQQRPDIIEAEQNLIAANARIGVARALYFPSVSLTGALGVASVDADLLFDGSSQAWQLGGDLFGPIFTFGAIEGQVMISEAAQREALYRYQQSIISGFREVEDALVATTKGRERQIAQERRTQALKNYSRLATYQYEAGTTSYLQVLDANRSLFSSQLDYVQTQTEAFTSLIDVYRALGGGWVNEADRMSGQSGSATDAADPAATEEG
ncbi:MAG: efflux transporter outer membrane subunit [Desulfofustis sp.]|nr:efflux transporter outer membrane subunit [Desulfofustis sp.]